MLFILPGQYTQHVKRHQKTCTTFKQRIIFIREYEQ